LFIRKSAWESTFMANLLYKSLVISNHRPEKRDAKPPQIDRANFIFSGERMVSDAVDPAIDGIYP
jgi:hypothetical protein